MGSSQNPTARKNGLVIQEMPEEVLVYDLKTNKAHCLNQTAAFVWMACNGENSVADIRRLLEKKFGASVDEDFIWLAIDQLNRDNLLEETVKSKFEGISRREAIKKVGLASVLALPIVASLAVPNSALAASSCIGTFCSTTEPCRCLTGACFGRCPGSDGNPTDITCNVGQPAACPPIGAPGTFTPCPTVGVCS
jgi:Coenzyme PQQ synthesis protein D (PqqD).